MKIKKLLMAFTAFVVILVGVVTYSVKSSPKNDSNKLDAATVTRLTKSTIILNGLLYEIDRGYNDSHSSEGDSGTVDLINSGTMYATVIGASNLNAQSVTIPDSIILSGVPLNNGETYSGTLYVGRIQDEAFNFDVAAKKMPNLASVTIGNISAIGRKAFYKCATITSLTFTTTTTKQPINQLSGLVIWNSAFENCLGLSTIRFYQTPYSLQASSFLGCNNAKIYSPVRPSIVMDSALPRNRNPFYFGYSSISDCMENESFYFLVTDSAIKIINFKYIASGSLIVPNNVTFERDTVSYTYPVKWISEVAGAHRSDITSFGLEGAGSASSNLVSLGSYAFYNSTGIKSISISGLKSSFTLGNHSFKGCTGLESIDLITGVTVGLTYGASVFENCTNLVTAYLKDQATTNVFFSGCSKLTNIFFGSNPRNVSNETSINNYNYQANSPTLQYLYFPKFNSGTMGQRGFHTSFYVLKGNIQASHLNSRSTLDSGLVPYYDYLTMSGVGSEFNIIRYTIDSSNYYDLLYTWAKTATQGGTIQTSTGYTTASDGDETKKIWEQRVYLLRTVSNKASLTIPSFIKLNDNNTLVETWDASSLVTTYNETNRLARIYPIMGIGAQAFRGNTSLTSLYLPKTLTFVQSDAFYSMTAKPTLYFPHVAALDEVHWGPRYNTNAYNTVWGYDAEIYLSYTPASPNNIFTYLLNQQTSRATIQIYNLTDKDHAITIPDTLTVSGLEGGNTAFNKTYSIAEIGNYVFQGKTNVASITFTGTNLTKIGEYAFSGMTHASFTSITLPASVTNIGANCFKGSNKLTSVSTPGITEVPFGCFQDCTALQTYTIPSSVVTIHNYAWFNCQALQRLVIPASLDEVGDFIVTPESVNRGWFYNCLNITIYITASANANAIKTQLLNGGFPDAIYEGRSARTYFPVLVMPAGATSADIYTTDTSEGTKYEYLKYASVSYITRYRGALGDRLTSSLTLPGTLGGAVVKYLSDNIFVNRNATTTNNYGFASITFPSSIVEIPYQALFAGNSAVTNYPDIVKVSLGTQTTTIRSRAFYGCTGLAYVGISQTVTVVEADVFTGCTNLLVSLAGGLPTIGDENWNTNWNSGKVPVIYNDTSFNNLSDTHLRLNPNGYDYVLIGSGNDYKIQIFRLNDFSLSEFTVPAKLSVTGSVTGEYEVIGIADYAFKNKTNLLKLTIIGTGITRLERTIDGCTNIRELVLPFVGKTRGEADATNGKLNYIYNGSNTSLQTLTINYSATPAVTIVAAAFSNFTGLTKLTINGPITGIGVGAFASLANLKYLIVNVNAGTTFTTGNSVASGTVKLINLVYPLVPATGLVTIFGSIPSTLESVALTQQLAYNSATFGSSSTLRNVNISSTVTTISGDDVVSGLVNSYLKVYIASNNTTFDAIANTNNVTASAWAGKSAVYVQNTNWWIDGNGSLGINIKIDIDRYLADGLFNKVYDSETSLNVAVQEKLSDDVVFLNVLYRDTNDSNSVMNAGTNLKGRVSITGANAARYSLSVAYTASNYYLVSNLTISPRLLSINLIDPNLEKIYDGNQIVPSGDYSVQGTIAESVLVTVEYLDENVGNEKPITLGASSANYRFNQNLFGKITTASLSYTSGTVTKVYDGNENVTTVVSGITGAKNSETIQIIRKYTINGTRSNASDVGSGIPLDLSFTVNGGNRPSSNYSIVHPVTTGAITTFGVKIQASIDKVFNNSQYLDNVAVVANTGSIPNGEVIKAQIDYTSKNVNSYANTTYRVTFTVTGGNFNPANYSLASSPTTAKITALPLTFGGSNIEKIYDASDAIQGGQVSLVTIAPESIVFTARYSTNANSLAAGSTANKTSSGGALTPNVTYYVWIAITSAAGSTASTAINNYTVTQLGSSVTGIIKQRKVVITGNVTKQYDGNSIVSTDQLTYTVEGGQILNQPITTNSAIYSGLNSSTTPYTTTITIKVNSATVLAPNYEIVNNTTNRMITPKELNVTGPSITKVYDGGTVASNGQISVPAGVSSEVLTWSAAYADKNVGVNITVTITISSVSGSKPVANYLIVYPSNGLKGTITVKQLTNSQASSISKIYNGDNYVESADVIFPVNSTGTTAGALVSGDSVTYSAQYDNANVGDSKTITYALSGSAAYNYSVTTANSTDRGVILIKTLELNITSRVKGYKTSDTSFTGFITIGIMSVDLATVSVTGTTASDASGVNVNITFNLIGNSNSNYQLPSVVTGNYAGAGSTSALTLENINQATGTGTSQFNVLISEAFVTISGEWFRTYNGLSTGIKLYPSSSTHKPGQSDFDNGLAYTLPGFSVSSGGEEALKGFYVELSFGASYHAGYYASSQLSLQLQSFDGSSHASFGLA
ncbi:hypothetical protein EZS27_009804, partial [termite gut metagenome]